MSSPPPADDDFDDALDLRIEAAMARVRLQMDPYLGPLKTAISAANMDVQAFRRKGTLQRLDPRASALTSLAAAPHQSIPLPCKR